MTTDTLGYSIGARNQPLLLLRNKTATFDTDSQRIGSNLIMKFAEVTAHLVIVSRAHSPPFQGGLRGGPGK